MKSKLQQLRSQDCHMYIPQGLYEFITFVYRQKRINCKLLWRSSVNTKAFYRWEGGLFRVYKGKYNRKRICLCTYGKRVSIKAAPISKAVKSTWARDKRQRLQTPPNRHFKDKNWVSLTFWTIELPHCEICVGRNARGT